MDEKLELEVGNGKRELKSWGWEYGTLELEVKNNK